MQRTGLQERDDGFMDGGNGDGDTYGCDVFTVILGTSFCLMVSGREYKDQ